MSKIFIPSPQQQAVFDWVKNGSGNAFVEAVAGSGKTTTLIEACKLTEGHVAFAAYNKKIAEEISLKLSQQVNAGKADADILQRIKVGTFHSFGFGAWRRVAQHVRVDGDAKTKQMLGRFDVPREMSSFVTELVSLAKQKAIGYQGSLLRDDPWDQIIEHHDLESLIEDKWMRGPGLAYAKQCLQWSIDVAHEIIDFDDMIYLPVVKDLKIWTRSWVFVDEAQDTNPARRILAKKMVAPRNGRVVFVGDRYQAIYGFTGADNDAVDLIIKDFKCQTLPLTQTYRCPKAVVEVAKEYVDHIYAADSAPLGVVRNTKQDNLIQENLKHGDAILCRKTKPLVDVAFALIRNNIPCYIEGRDFGKGLTKLVNRFEKRAKNIDGMIRFLEDHKEKEVKRLTDKGRESFAGEVSDRIDTVLALITGVTTIAALKEKITNLFEDSTGNPKPAVVLSTVHKSKGREWNRVFILGYSQYMPSGWAKKDWELEQETNIIYVAVTRSMNELILVEATKKE